MNYLKLMGKEINKVENIIIVYSIMDEGKEIIKEVTLRKIVDGIGWECPDDVYDFASKGTLLAIRHNDQVLYLEGKERV